MPFIRLLFLFLSLSCFSSAFGHAETPPPRVLVSVAPLRYLVKRIAEDKVTISLLVPPGASPHSFEPSSRSVLQASESVIWFRVGDSFEKRLLDVLSSHNSSMEVVDLRKDLTLLPISCGHVRCALDADAADSHIWLSPMQLKIMAKQIASALSRHFPNEADFFYANLTGLLADLEALDREIHLLLKDIPQRSILVSHPAFGYFCRDYKLHQHSIEVEGKEPSAKQLGNLLAQAREDKIQRVYVQKQYNMKAARLVAKELNAEIIPLDPYDENVLANLRNIANALKG